ncbi:MAG: RluA family pseudouridine synthase [Elusimicrobia bacterium]|nr:RluA family pseudouridine synthase [Elusimicrobiota bacterium]
MNSGHDYRVQLGGDARGQELVEYLAANYRHSTRVEWGERIVAGLVSLDGQAASPETRLRPGQVLDWRRPPWDEPAVPLEYAVLHEDADLLAVAKPAGLPTMPAGGFLENTLLALVRRRDPAWAPMHRLGRGTSGLVVFAREPSVRAGLQEAWRGHEVRKDYLAVAEGAVPEGPFDVTAPIGRRRHPVLGALHAADPGGRPASSTVKLLGRAGGGSLVQVRIATGRPHQIRIHLAWAGHPLAGDPLYGPGGVPREGTAALPGDLGYRLHAWRLGFAHPGTGRLLELEAPLPKWAVFGSENA